MSSFCSAKATHIYSAKNIRILYIESAKTVNEMTLNELVKLTTLWTTGPKMPSSCWFFNLHAELSGKETLGYQTWEGNFMPRVNISRESYTSVESEKGFVCSTICSTIRNYSVSWQQVIPLGYVYWELRLITQVLITTADDSLIFLRFMSLTHSLHTATAADDIFMFCLL